MNWTRRKFLGASAAAPIVAPVGLDLVTAIQAAPDSSNSLTGHERNALLIAMDEIIPGSDGMPSASEAGGLWYLEGIAAGDAAVAGEIRECLAALDNSSKEAFAKSFDQLDHESSILALKRLETAAPLSFARLRDYVYEAYYTRPAVWKLIGYEFYPTDHPGPHMEPFDDSILATVRKRSKLYREA